jgi:tetratricopeptide (TPR) repeat protein
MDSLRERRAQALDAHKRGALNEADSLYRGILAEAQRDGETWHHLAVLRGQQDRPADVLTCCREALGCGYRTAAVYANLALAHRSLGDDDAAKTAFLESLGLDPGDADLTLDYIDLLRSSGDEHAALIRLRDACERFPADARFHAELGRLAAELNEGRLAEEEFRCAIRLESDSAELWLNVGNILQMRGDAAGAEAAYRQALTIDAGFDPAYWYLAQLAGPERNPALADTIIARAATRASANSASIRFAAGKVHHDAGRIDLAFAAYAAGNLLVRGSFDYSVQADIGAMAALTASLGTDAAPLAPSPGSGDQPTPIFILGMPRSGSTLIEQMLGRHPAVSAGGEIVWLQRYVRHALRAAGMAYPVDQLMLSDDVLVDVRRRYLAALTMRCKSTPFVTDKLPGNFLCIPTIRRLFPEARVVHARRDPLEACWSCYRHLFTGGQRFAYDLAEVGGYYKAATAFIDACRARWPEHVIDMPYETLIEDPERRMRSLLQSLALDWDQQCLMPEATTNVVMTASAVQVRNGISPVPHRSAERYADYLEPLRSALRPAATAPG